MNSYKLTSSRQIVVSNIRSMFIHIYLFDDKVLLFISKPKSKPGIANLFETKN
jgi:hypothetical protein